MNKTIAQHAMNVSVEAANLGFDWACAADVLDKIDEELQEIRQAMNNGDTQDHLTEEIGDLYFALVNLTRKMQIDPDIAFQKGVMKFERRFNALKEIVASSNRQVNDLTAEELDNIWRRVKSGENHGC